MILYFLLVLCNLSLVHLELYPEDSKVDPCNKNAITSLQYTLQFTAQIDRDNPENKSIVYESSEIPFTKDNANYSCGFDDNRRIFICVSQLSPDCDKREHHPKLPKGEMGIEINSGTWRKRHEVSFTYDIGEKQYIFGHSISKTNKYTYILYELSQNEGLGEETEYGYFDDYYQVVFPFSINGRQFFYGHSANTKVWFIRELLPGGRMGEETDRGSWDLRYSVSFPFSIDGRYYFYGQSIIDGTYWFIQELLPNGRMGQEKDFGNWVYNYQVAFPFFINGRHFFYGHNTEGKKNWFIQELLQGGKMGLETDQGVWNTRHQVSVPFKIDGKQYFYAQSIMDGKYWFIQELLPNGRMGKETDHGVWNDKYPVVIPFKIKGEQYLYGHSHKSKHWFIRSLN